MTTGDERKELRRLCQSSSPLPWEPDIDDPETADARWSGKVYVGDGERAVGWYEDLQGIFDLRAAVACRAAAPALLDELDAMDVRSQQQLTRQQEVLQTLRSHIADLETIIARRDAHAELARDRTLGLEASLADLQRRLQHSDLVQDLKAALKEAMDLVRYEPTWLSEDERATAERLRKRWSL